MSWPPGWQRQGSCCLMWVCPCQARQAARHLSIQTLMPIRGSSGLLMPPQMLQQGHGIPAQGSIALR